MDIMAAFRYRYLHWYWYILEWPSYRNYNDNVQVQYCSMLLYITLLFAKKEKVYLEMYTSNGNILSLTTRRGRMINSVMKATYTMKYAERTIKLNHSNNSSHPKSFLDRQNFVLSFFRLFSLNCMSKVVPYKK
jgi:hypothetical protein